MPTKRWFVTIDGGHGVAPPWPTLRRRHAQRGDARAHGGIGLGLGYISPVSSWVKWFPDRRGMATGMAIMGFGGRAMIGAPLADIVMNHFKTAASIGAWETFVTMAAIYFVFMMIGAFRYRLPPTDWRPEGWTPPSETKSMIT